MKYSEELKGKLKHAYYSKQYGFKSDRINYAFAFLATLEQDVTKEEFLFDWYANNMDEYVRSNTYVFSSGVLIHKTPYTSEYKHLNTIDDVEKHCTFGCKTLIVDKIYYDEYMDLLKKVILKVATGFSDLSDIVFIERNGFISSSTLNDYVCLDEYMKNNMNIKFLD